MGGQRWPISVQVYFEYRCILVLPGSCVIPEIQNMSGFLIQSRSVKTSAIDIRWKDLERCGLLLGPVAGLRTSGKGSWIASSWHFVVPSVEHQENQGF